MSVKHNLKITADQFIPLMQGKKKFDIRKNDRGIIEGDVMYLQEWENGKYTGRSCTVLVTYITTYMQRKGYVVFGIEEINSQT
ncbi:DUF3850 domain-containing protein [Bacillus amyloliquefaciens]|uniref:DUF3850 domain-containing protein n=1 Tax=Bacillus amyloliquefaciens TaxID=1390 RepID=UPI0032DF4F1D